MANEELISVYLKDHLAGSRAGLDLARRSARRNGDGKYGRALSEIAKEIADDRQALTALMEDLGVRPSRLKLVGAWVTERVGRLKPNGRLIGYSPLSRLVEIEGLIVGVSGKLELWRALKAASNGNRLEGTDLENLIGRAESQRERLERLHDEAAAEAFA